MHSSPHISGSEPAAMLCLCVLNVLNHSSSSFFYCRDSAGSGAAVPESRITMAMLTIMVAAETRRSFLESQLAESQSSSGFYLPSVSAGAYGFCL